MIRLLIADDHAIMRAGLVELFASQSEVGVLGQASSGAEVLALVRSTPADVLLLDMTMPGDCGVPLIVQLRQLQPALPVLVLSMNGDQLVVQRALESGASGYLTKGCDIVTLMTAIRSVAAGGRYIESALAQSMVLGSGQAPHLSLSRREREVLVLLVAGHRLGEIADQLFLSAKTVSTHKMNLMNKLGVESNAELIRYAVLHGLG
jgi:DNA-binding NarL/FixJ family response regulator